MPPQAHIVSYPDQGVNTVMPQTHLNPPADPMQRNLSAFSSSNESLKKSAGDAIVGGGLPT